MAGMSESGGGYQTGPPVNYDNIDASGGGLEQMESLPKSRRQVHQPLACPPDHSLRGGWLR